MADKFCLKMPDFYLTFRDLLHAVNLRHGTDGFTSPQKEGLLRIFSPWKIQRLRSGLNPRTCVPKASTLLLDHQSRFCDDCCISFYFSPDCYLLYVIRVCYTHICVNCVRLLSVSQTPFGWRTFWKVFFTLKIVKLPKIQNIYLLLVSDDWDLKKKYLMFYGFFPLLL